MQLSGMLSVWPARPFLAVPAAGTTSDIQQNTKKIEQTSTTPGRLRLPAGLPPKQTQKQSEFSPPPTS